MIFGFLPTDLRTLRALKTPSAHPGVHRRADLPVCEHRRVPAAHAAGTQRPLPGGRAGGGRGLRIQGHPPLVMDLEGVRDDDHVVAIYRERGLWGSVAKSNFAGLRFAQPVYARCVSWRQLFRALLQPARRTHAADSSSSGEFDAPRARDG